jgi:hypothetical protein
MHTKLLAGAAAVAISLAGFHSARAAGSQSGHWSQSSRLLLLMDRDRNGTVSKTEFSQFMGRRFRRLDTNHNGKLERNELRPLIVRRRVDNTPVG